MMAAAYVTAAAAVDDEGELGANEDSQGIVGYALEAASLEDQEGEESHHRRRHHHHHHRYRSPYQQGRYNRFRRSAIDEEDADDATAAAYVEGQDDQEAEANSYRGFHHHGHRRHHSHGRRHQGYYGRRRQF